MIKIHKVNSKLEVTLFMEISTLDGKVKKINLSKLNRTDKTKDGKNQNLQYLILPRT